MPLTNCLAKMIRNVLVTAESVSISSGRCLLNRSSVSSSVCSSLSTLGLCHRSFTIFSEFMQKRAEKISRIPFGVRRTASDNFPVYLKWRKNKTEVFTVLKKIHGNKQILKSELQTICESPVKEQPGWFEVNGNHKVRIKQWLMHIGY
eukprot:GHVQ01015049.1.p2 GENE.GHVQ01015049.1~~GHVQ01015049.1.p2  ORF type:complete len:148 (-),score=10.61 GHVQ01015049.1:427-870(-)